MVLAHRPGPGRYVLIQATVLVCVFLLLAVTPAPVTFPSGPWEVALLLKGAAALLLTDVILAGLTRDRARKPRGTVKVRGSSAELTRANRLGHYHVQDSEGVIGLVDEVIGDRLGVPQALVVTSGWFGRRRFLVGLDELRSIDHEERTIGIENRRPA